MLASAGSGALDDEAVARPSPRQPARLLGGVEEGPLRHGEVGVGPGLPVERLQQADTAVELAVGPAHAVPRVGGEGHVAADAMAFDVVVQPRLQPRPGAGERFMGQLDRVVVAGDQPGSDEQFDELLVFRVGSNGAAGDAAAHRFAFRRGGHEAQEQVAQQRPLGRWYLVVHLLRRLGNRSSDPSGVLIPVDGERAAFAPLPRLVQGVRQQRQCARLALDLPYQQIDETRFQQETGLTGRTLDRGAKVAFEHGAQQVQSGLDEPDEVGMAG